MCNVLRVVQESSQCVPHVTPTPPPTTTRGNEKYNDNELYLTTLHRENRGKWSPKNPFEGKHREFGNFARIEGILFVQVVNFLI